MSILFERRNNQSNFLQGIQFYPKSFLNFFAAGLVACSQIMGQSIREDIGMMFGQFHVAKALLGVKFLKLNNEKGWLIPPPLHLQTPEKG